MKTNDHKHHVNQKVFVLDTNVLIHRPDAFLSFRGCDVILPLWVLEELDNLKRDHHGRGRSARHAIRKINDAVGRGSLHRGVKLENGGTLKVSLKYSQNIPPGFLIEKMDNKIILCALEQMEKGHSVFFVSKDINARIKATALGIKAVDYEKNKVNIKSLYEGMSEMTLDESEFEKFRVDGFREYDEPILANEFVLVHEKGQGKTVHLGRYNLLEKRIDFVDSHQESVLGIKPFNVQQRMAFDLLLDDSIPLVTMVGRAGTGKTLLALAAALKKTLNDKKYSRVLVTRPIIPMGNDIGYLPGAKSAKMSHWMQPVFDNLELIIESGKQQNLKSIDQLLNNKVIEIEALTYIRGRSLPRQYIIIDEAQNLTPHEVKTVVSRAGEGTKVILCGDPYQIDSPYLDAESNGLSYLVEAFKSESLAGHITLSRTERSPLADLAAELL
jgi:PhoH-like ATPase